MYGGRKDARRSRKNAQIIIQECIETAIEDGDPIPEPYLFNDVVV